MAAWASSPGLANHNIRGKIEEEFVSQYNYTASKDDELSLTVGMRLLVLDKDNDGWWLGKTVSGRSMSGWFPSTYVKKSATSPSNPPPPQAVVPPPNDKIMVARSLYPYAGRHAEELTIEQFELLDIIEDPPNEPEWWLARNSEGKTGLVPKNYVEKQPDGPISHSNYDRVTPFQNDAQSSPLHTSASPKTLAPNNSAGSGGGNKSIAYTEKPWFYGDMSRGEAEKILGPRAGVGEFLLRNSSQRGELCISVRAPAKFRHFKVCVLPDGQYGIGQRKFQSIDTLFEHYTKAPIFTSAQEKVFLTRPVHR